MEGPYNKDCNILESILWFCYLGKRFLGSPVRNRVRIRVLVSVAGCFHKQEPTGRGGLRITYLELTLEDNQLIVG